MPEGKPQCLLKRRVNKSLFSDLSGSEEIHWVHLWVYLCVCARQFNLYSFSFSLTVCKKPSGDPSAAQTLLRPGKNSHSYSCSASVHTCTHTHTHLCSLDEPPPAGRHAITRPLHQKDDTCFSVLPFILRRTLGGTAPNASYHCILNFIFLEAVLPLLRAPNFFFFFYPFHSQSCRSGRWGTGCKNTSKTTGDYATESSLKSEKVTGRLWIWERAGAHKEESRGRCTRITENKIRTRKNKKITRKNGVSACMWWYSGMRKTGLAAILMCDLCEAACLIKAFWNLQELSVNQCNTINLTAIVKLSGLSRLQTPCHDCSHRLTRDAQLLNWEIKQKWVKQNARRHAEIAGCWPNMFCFQNARLDWGTRERERMTGDSREGGECHLLDKQTHFILHTLLADYEKIMHLRQLHVSLSKPISRCFRLRMKVAEVGWRREPSDTQRMEEPNAGWVWIPTCHLEANLHLKDSEF